jgi:phosphoheptose isomerase
VLACGNGGGASSDQHFAGELVGQFMRRGRPGLPAISLTADSAVVTACSNDMGYENVFARQLQALAKPEDVLVCIDTDGTSPSLLKACRLAREMGLGRVALAGAGGGELARLAEVAVVVPASDGQRVQEVHLLALHLICALVEERTVARRGGR